MAHYDVAADDKKRINLRGAKTKYFHVKALSNGCYLLEPRVLVPPHAISSRSLKMLGKSVASLKKGLASAPVDLSAFMEDYQCLKLSALPAAKPKSQAKD